MKYYLTLDENSYLLSISTVGGDVEAEINLAEYDLTGNRINAHKWKKNKLIFDKTKYAEITAAQEAAQEIEQEEPETPTEDTMTVYDELAAAYMEGVQEA